MTLDEWQHCSDPQDMLTWLDEQGGLSPRKARLFGVSVCRRITHLLPDPRSRQALAVGERYADGQVGPKALERAAAAAFAATDGPFPSDPREESGAYLHAAMAAWWVVNDAEACDAGEVCNRAYGATVCDPDDPEVEDEAQAALLRCVIGPRPFRRVRLGKAGKASEVVSLATRIYERRAFRRLPDLAALLASHGCTDTELLAHLKAGGSHAGRGCWGLDAVLGRE